MVFYVESTCGVAMQDCSKGETLFANNPRDYDPFVLFRFQIAQPQEQVLCVLRT